MHYNGTINGKHSYKIYINHIFKNEMKKNIFIRNVFLVDHLNKSLNGLNVLPV